MQGSDLTRDEALSSQVADVIEQLSEQDKELLLGRTKHWGSWHWDSAQHMCRLGLGTRTADGIVFDTELAALVKAELDPPPAERIEVTTLSDEKPRYVDVSPDAGAVREVLVGPDDKDTGMKIDCLDHGFVRLVDWMGGDISVVRAARVSYDAAWRAGEDEGSDTRLLNYLWRNHHTSPFEAVTLTFEVKAPIFIFRQWHRHRTWSYNELSARYRELPAEFYLPDPNLIGQQSASSKQARDIQAVEGRDLAKRSMEVETVRNHCSDAFHLYQRLLGEGWPRELARSVLPVNTYSHMFATVNLLNLFRFLGLRDHSHAQYEIQVYAKAMKELARLVAPVCVGAFEKTQSPEK